MGNFSPKKVLFAGCGNMGSAILDGALKHDLLLPAQVTMLERFGSEKVVSFFDQGVKWAKDVEVTEDGPDKTLFDVIILAVKPQDFQSVTVKLVDRLTDRGFVISVMAGVSISKIKNEFGGVGVMRVMPNTPASIGEGTTGICFDHQVSDEQIAWTEELFRSLGKVVIANTEDLIDSVTAISGSGPAYLFYLAEAMTEQAKKLGFSTENAKILVNQTLKGASLLLDQSSDSASELRAKVTSKGGTTFAATEEFDAQGVKEGIKSGIQKAFERSKELGS